MFKLYDYQEEAIKEIIRHKNNDDILRQLVVLPTGAGKTVVFSTLINRHFKRDRVLILAHRDELIQQAKEKYEFIAGDASDVGIFAGGIKELDKRVTIASIQTIKNHLDKFEPDAFKLIVCDESHHSGADSYLKIFDYFQVFQGKTFLLGFTATPTRTDSRELGQIFQKITYQKIIFEMIEKGFLCRPVGMQINTEMDISSVKISLGDFNQKQLSNKLDTPERNKAIVEAYKKLCPDDKAIVFCIDKQHSKNITDEFVLLGIKAKYIDADTPKEERKQILKDFSTGEVKVLCNVGVLTEGFDEPSIQAVILTRPTQSEALYSQMIGRGLRKHPDKEFCKIIDIVDNTGNNKLKTMGFILNQNVKAIDLKKLNEKKDKKEDKKQDKQLEIAELWNEAAIFDSVSKNLEITLNATRIFGSGRKYIWLGSGDYRFIEIGSGDYKKVIEISCTDQDKKLFQIFVNGQSYLKKPVDFNWAFSLAEEYLNENVQAHEKKLIDADAEWRNQEASINQIKFLHWQTRISKIELSYLSKGEASELISNFKSNLISKDDAKNMIKALIKEKRRAKIA